MSAHTIFVCTTCASKWENGQRVGESGGEKLLKRLEAEYPNWQLNSQFVLKPVQCMSACSRSCAISFVASGKTTYLFGDVAADLTDTEVRGVFECAEKYYLNSQGSLPWSERPEPLKKGILAKIPSVELSVNNNTAIDYQLSVNS